VIEGHHHFVVDGFDYLNSPDARGVAMQLPMHRAAFGRPRGSSSIRMYDESARLLGPDWPTTTWNDQQAIDHHRSLSPEERLRLALEASRAALRFAQGRRVGE
jgi:hypothetical protein